MNKQKRDRFYAILCTLLTMVFIGSMLFMSAQLPHLGQPDNPDVNEVPAFYVEEGPRETGALNAVTAMILHYRAFDTLGESCVLFVAAVSVFILLRIDGSASNDTIAAIDRRYEPVDDPILSNTFVILVPAIFLFGIYITMNGHLSPGGGFSGGAVLAAGLLLYLNAYGPEKTERILSSARCKRLTALALSFYTLAKGYTFYVGANGMESFESAGTPGRILSAGLILPLNLCVAVIVAMTIYSMYIMIRKGGFNK